MAERTEETGFGIGDLARRSGVPVSTIRSWEQRYGVLAPARTAGGHRRYGDEDLRRIEAMRQLVGQGVSLAAAAERVMGREGAGAASVPTRDERLPLGVATHPLPTAGLDPRALEAAYRATRALLYIRTAEQAVDILIDVVLELGGSVVPAADAEADALPLDLSLGVRSPLLPMADPYSVARLQLERVLPLVVDDARRAAASTRRLARLGDTAGRR